MPSQIALFLPIIAAVVSYLMQQEHWPTVVTDREKAWLNGTVAALTIVCAVIVDQFIQGKLTGNAQGDILLIGSATAALQVETYRPLQQWLREIGFPPPAAPAVPAEPTPIILPSSRVSIETKEQQPS